MVERAPTEPCEPACVVRVQAFGFCTVPVVNPVAGQEVHILPVHDTRVHQLAATCPCSPAEDHEQASLWVHNAWDRRERHFEHGTPLH